jgi:hypothetical protein
MMAEIKESLDGVTRQLDNRQRQLEKLRITAPRDGFIIPVAEVPRRSGGNELQPWSGSPLDPHNRHAFLKTGDLICRVGDPRKFDVILSIDQSDIEFVKPGQAVSVILDAYPTERRTTRLASISRLDMEGSPASVSPKAEDDLLTLADSNSHEQPRGATYQASAHLDDPAGHLFNGATGKARIRVGHQTIAQRAWRLACQTFKFDE